MRVLVLGMCRTRTSAKPREPQALWNTRVRQAPRQERCRLGQSKLFVRKRTVEAYPDGKVILTTRNYQDWEVSMQDSIWCQCTWNLFRLARYLDITEMTPLMRFIQSIFRVHNNNTYGGTKSRAAFKAHFSTIDAKFMSWEPLCEFLSQQISKERFPRTMEEKEMRGYLKNAWWSLAKYCAGKLVLPLIVVLTAWVMYTNADDLRAARDDFILRPIAKFLKS
ncbi:hypothetical protein BDU57DRAFT_589599 [Ampelomyces quisqualis]|uniref:Uncharacterized protein n=1 Tax=Ampelomyces quisqualis TaxID=50730 RepID=A0A6A5QD51_AMPQU|nr:hypothetical protein BDU57DRAFT_589599 [Ampelomyces quisqualis]